MEKYEEKMEKCYNFFVGLLGFTGLYGLLYAIMMVVYYL